MNLLHLVSLLIASFGVYVFGAFLLFRFQHGCRVGHSVRGTPTSNRRAGRIGQIILTFCFGWFVLALAIELNFIASLVDQDWLRLIQLMGSFGFPPLIMHVVHAEHSVAAAARFSHPLWRRLIHFAYAASALIAVASVLMIFDVIPATRRQTSMVIGLGIGGLFSLASIYAVLAAARARKESESSTEASARRWTGILYLLMIPLCAAMIVASFGGASFGQVLRVVGSSMPLAFIFAGTYFDQRFVFFDVLLKRGLALLLTIVLLTAYFGLILPWLERLELDWARPWVYAVLLLPLAMAMPWLYRKLGKTLDNRWLGRRFTTVEAVKRFLSGMQRETGESGLVAQAVRGLAEIFRAPTRIDLQLREAPALDFDCVVDLPIPSGGPRVGVILMGRRANQMPYFSEDFELLASLADVFSYMLENVRLQQKRQEQEQRAKELSLQASRTELKALRAQVNPHFLFNALNVIAGLIHKDPMRADSTVEQLAEVFRYTLRGSEKEWAFLEAELEFARAYLEVEQARFGRRLQVRFDVEDRVQRIRIPTMMLQTLVENAVKHGIASITGPARIEIAARRDAERLILEVADNGKGLAASRNPQRGIKGEGYGLKNIRQRLEGYFGDAAVLTIGEDEARGMTLARISLPVEHDAAAPSDDETRDRSGTQGAA